MNTHLCKYFNRYERPRKTWFNLLGVGLKQYAAKEARAWREHCEAMQKELDDERASCCHLRFYDNVFVYD